MTLRPLSREESRAVDVRARDIGLSTLVLMENAGRGACEILLAELPAGARVVVACGAGNNGGDGGVLARHLDARGVDVRVVWFAPLESIAGDARVQHTILAGAEIRQEEWPGPVEPASLEALFAEADWVVDGLLGTGLTRPVEGLYRDVIEAMNRSRRPILALDLPSGLGADSGDPLGEAVRATITATFVGRKLGFARPEAATFTGRVEVVDIGVPRRLLAGFVEPRG